MLMMLHVLMLISRNLHMKSSEVSIKTRSTPASLSFKGQATKHTTVKWSIGASSKNLPSGQLWKSHLGALSVRLNYSVGLLRHSLVKSRVFCPLPLFFAFLLSRYRNPARAITFPKLLLSFLLIILL